MWKRRPRDDPRRPWRLVPLRIRVSDHLRRRAIRLSAAGQPLSSLKAMK